jgi:hypothetical protein
MGLEVQSGSTSSLIEHEIILEAQPFYVPSIIQTLQQHMKEQHANLLSFLYIITSKVNHIHYDTLYKHPCERLSKLPTRMALTVCSI